MHASLVRRQLGGLIPPKIASPGLLVRSLYQKATRKAPAKFVLFYLSLEVLATAFRRS